jgi:hypothetical protein
MISGAHDNVNGSGLPWQAGAHGARGLHRRVANTSSGQLSRPNSFGLQALDQMTSLSTSAQAAGVSRRNSRASHAVW